MDQEIFFLICVSPLILNIGLGIYLVVNLSRYRLSPTARSLIAMVFGGALWSFGYSMEIISADLPAKLFWAKFQYFGIATIPLAWFSFAYQYVGLDGRSQMPVSQRLAISFLPAVTIVLVWTNELHGLIWRGVQLQPVGSFKVLQLDHGPGFWVYWAYSYCLLFVGSFRLVVGLISSFQTNRRRNVIRLAAILIPWFANLVYVSELNPIPHLDWSPFSFTVAGLLFSISLYHFSLIDILPIAEKKVFEVLPDCLLVLDAYGNLVDMNAAAKKMVPDASLDWRGKPLADIVPELYQWVSQADFTREYRFETTRAAASGKVFHDLRIVPLTSFDHRPVGHLVACHDITPYRRVQAQLEQIRDQLEVTVAQRTAELRSTVDQLQFELVERTLAEKRFQDVVESAPDAMLLVDQDGKIRLVNAQAEALFGCSRESLLGQNIEAMIAEDTRHLHSEYVNQFLAFPSIRQISFDLTLSACRKNGSVFPIEISLSSLNSSDGVLIAYSVRDITERKLIEDEQNRLLEQIRQSREQLRELAIRLSEAQEYNQRLIAAELHDRVGQNLTGLNLNLQVIQNLVPAEGFTLVRRRLEDSMNLVEETTRQVRNVMAELNPPLLEEFGLGPALRFYCEKFMDRTGIQVNLSDGVFHSRFSSRQEMALFRIVQEGLNNVARHSHATHVDILMEISERFVTLSIEDNGQGFDLASLQIASSQPHWGLLNVQERAASIGGDLQIHSTPGKGTCLIIVIRKRTEND